MKSRTATRVTTGQVAKLEDSLLAFQQLTASRQVHQRLIESTGVDVTAQETRVILALLDGPVSPSDIARRLRMDPGAVSRQISSLEETGFVTRTIDPDDTRRSTVALTRRGRQAAETVARQRRRHLVESLAEWSPDAVTNLADLLQRLVDDMQATPYSR